MTVILKHLNSATFRKDSPIYPFSERQLALGRALRVNTRDRLPRDSGRCGTADFPSC